MAYVETWDETKPAGSRDANLGDDDIREFKRALRERLAGGGMHFPSTDDANAGLFDWVKFIEQSSNPSSEANRSFLFTKDVSGVTELYWMDSAGTVTQLTSGGKLLIGALTVASQAQGDIIYFNGTSWVRLAAGTSGYFLQTLGAGANPAWAAASFQTAATQAEQETGSITTAPVTPGRQHFHQSAAKAHMAFNGTGVPAVIGTPYNFSSTITDNGTGDYTLTFTNALSTANYVALITPSLVAGSSAHAISQVVKTTTTIRFKVRQTDNQALVDCDDINVTIYGDI